MCISCIGAILWLWNSRPAALQCCRSSSGAGRSVITSALSSCRLCYKRHQTRLTVQSLIALEPCDWADGRLELFWQVEGGASWSCPHLAGALQQHVQAPTSCTCCSMTSPWFCLLVQYHQQSLDGISAGPCQQHEALQARGLLDVKQLVHSVPGTTAGLRLQHASSRPSWLSVTVACKSGHSKERKPARQLEVRKGTAGMHITMTTPGHISRTLTAPRVMCL